MRAPATNRDVWSLTRCTSLARNCNASRADNGEATEAEEAERRGVETTGSRSSLLVQPLDVTRKTVRLLTTAAALIGSSWPGMGSTDGDDEPTKPKKGGWWQKRGFF